MGDEALRAKLMAKVQLDESGCWNWLGAKRRKGLGTGYSWMHIPGERSAKSKYAHGIFYKEFIGPIPEGLELDHLCRNRGCVNPAHLEPVTHAENMRRAATAFCLRGHVKVGLGAIGTKGHEHECRQCKRDRDKAAYHHRKSQGSMKFSEAVK